MAAPHVAAAAAIVKSYYSGWGNTAIREHLQATAHDLGATGWDQYFGYGRLDVGAAVAPPLVAHISGPEDVQPYSQCLWEADVTGGEAPYSYWWYRNESLVSINPFYWGNTGSQHFSLELVVEDSGDDSDSDALYILVDENAPECGL